MVSYDEYVDEATFLDHTACYSMQPSVQHPLGMVLPMITRKEDPQKKETKLHKLYSPSREL